MDKLLPTLSPSTLIRWGMYVAGGLAVLFLSFFILKGGELALILLNVLCVAALLVALAYCFPLTTLTLWVLASQYVHEFMGAERLVVGGGLKFDPADPVLFGAVGACGLALVLGNPRVRYFISALAPLWTLFMAWLVFQVVRSLPEYGLVSSLGEFRHYFKHLLILPYLYVFVDTTAKRHKLFMLLIALAFGFVFVGLWKGAALSFHFEAYLKWLDKRACLALAWGIIATYLLARHNQWRWGPVKTGLLIAAAAGLILICGHRSVWLAGAFAGGLLVFTGQLSLGKTLGLGVAAIFLFFAVDLIFSGVDMVAYLDERLTALTNYQEDTTANWRHEVWQFSLTQIRLHPWLGKGLGGHFTVENSDGWALPYHPHNLYIQICYQVGIIGLALFLAFAGQVFYRLYQSFQHAYTAKSYVIVLHALIVFTAVWLYHVAYSMDPATWLFVGLALSHLGPRTSRAPSSSSSVTTTRQGAYAA